METKSTYTGATIIDNEKMIVEATVVTKDVDAYDTSISPHVVDYKAFMHGHAATVIHAHQKSDVVGKVLSLLISNATELLARVQFAPTERGREIYTLYRDGYLSDWSAGYDLPTSKYRFVNGIKIFTYIKMVHLSTAVRGANEKCISRSLEDDSFYKGGLEEDNRLNVWYGQFVENNIGILKGKA